MPHSHSPIIWACKENWTFLCIPERITSDTINRSSMTIIVIKILIWIWYWASMNWAILGCSKIIYSIFTFWEINTNSIYHDRMVMGIFAMHTIIAHIVGKKCVQSSLSWSVGDDHFKIEFKFTSGVNLRK